MNQSFVDEAPRRNTVPSLPSNQGAVTPDRCLCLILGYSKFFVLFGAPLNDKTTNNSIKKLRFLMQNNVQFNVVFVY